MKKVLLILGIVFLISSVILALGGLLFRFSFYNVLDGSNDLYTRLHTTYIILFICAFIVFVLGIVCLIVRRTK